MSERIKEQDTVEKLFWQVMGESPRDQLHRFAELVRQDEREQLRNRTYHEQQLMDGQASLLKGRT
jgi:hypothetical protein